MKRVILAPRVSSDDQAKGTSLRTQEEEMQSYCLKEGYEVAAIYREDHSAKNFNRPEFTKLLQFIKANKGKIDLLLVTTWCRFSRNITESFAMMDRLRKLGVEVQAIEQPLDLSIPENLMLLSVYLAIPDIDNRRRSMKITTGVRACKKEGRWLGKAPYGYQSIRSTTNKTVIIPGEAAPIVKKAFSLITKGKTQAEVREALKKEGKHFSRNSLSTLLRNRLYLGEVRVKTGDHDGFYFVKGLHEPLVSVDLFNTVGAILEGRLVDRGFVKAKSEKEEFALRGMLLCGECGKSMTGSASKGRNGRHCYYHCNHCGKVRLRTSEVHERMESILNEINFEKKPAVLFKAMMEKLIRDGNIRKGRSKENIEHEVAEVKARMQNMEDDYADRKITHEHCQRTLLRYEEQQQKLNLELLAVSDDATTYQRYLKSGLSITENLKHLYQKALPSEKKDILGSIFPEKIQISKNESRTARLNEAIRLILATDKGFRNKNTGQLFKNIELSRNVETTGVEPIIFDTIISPSNSHILLSRNSECKCPVYRTFEQDRVLWMSLASNDNFVICKGYFLADDSL